MGQNKKNKKIKMKRNSLGFVIVDWSLGKLVEGRMCLVMPSSPTTTLGLFRLLSITDS